jgi:hypothetical protein
MNNKPDWLLSYGRNVQSKDGEDGIIEKIFETIGEKSRWCVDLGALTGTSGSNTWSLVKEKGWNGVLIEADPTYFAELQNEYAGKENAVCINAFISFEGEQSLDAILAKTAIPKEFDFFSIDIDGNDYHVWKSLTQYRPRVVCIEFNPSIPNEVSFVQPADMRVNQGSSLQALVALAKGKGYELIAANKDNAFFVDRVEFPKFEMDNSSLDAVHADKSAVTYLFQLYDGTMKLAGNRELLWHHVPIDEEKIQILSRRKRIFPNKISPSDALRAFKQAARKSPIYPLVQRIRKSL